MLIVTARCSLHTPESVEDHVSANISHVVHVSELDLVVRGVAVDLLQMAKRVGSQCEAAEHEDLSREKSLPLALTTTSLSVSKPADLG